MTLTTHAVVGAAAASLVPANPWLAFLVGFASHFVMDALPHWDYHLASGRRDKKNPLNNDIVIGPAFAGDLLKIGLDALLGLLIVYLVFFLLDSVKLSVVLWGALGAIAPDPLQFIYMKYRREPMLTLQKFHIWVHSKKYLENQFWGIVWQTVIIIIAILIVNNLYHL